MPEKTSPAPEIGKKAPAFSLESQRGEHIGPGAFKGQPVVLYFYPKDDTPGCTIEAQAFQKALQDFERQGTAVLGVSPDSVASHCKFADKYGLGFHLLADTEHAVAEKYGVWVEKSLYGRKYMGVQRATFLIGPDGRLARIWPKVSPEGHAAEVLEALAALAP